MNTYMRPLTVEEYSKLDDKEAAIYHVWQDGWLAGRISLLNQQLNNHYAKEDLKGERDDNL